MQGPASLKTCSIIVPSHNLHTHPSHRQCLCLWGLVGTLLATNPSHPTCAPAPFTCDTTHLLSSQGNSCFLMRDNRLIADIKKSCRKSRVKNPRVIKGKEILCKPRVSLAYLVLPLHFSLCLLQVPAAAAAGAYVPGGNADG